MIPTYNDFICEIKESIDPIYCKNLIEKFEQTPERHEKGMSGKNEYKPNVKDSTDIYIVHEDSRNPEWREVLSPFLKVLTESIKIYSKKYIGLSFIDPFRIGQEFNIQRYLPREGFKKWHSESGGTNHADRKIVWMFYLNDVDDGGTIFLHQRFKASAETGSLLIWPADWTHTHKGIISKTKTKYILTGWYVLEDLGC
jgi:hypothetical protein